jgi:hypothetical protein
MKCGDKITVDGVEMAVRGYSTDAQGRLCRIEAVRVPDRIVWWFNPVSKMTASHTDDVDLSPDWLEVTLGYAEYLRDDPGDGWELRKPKRGDCMLGWSGSAIQDECVCAHPFDTQDDNAPHDRGYRWCKVKPVVKWHEYPVEARNGVWMVTDYNGGALTLHKAMSRVGFGGVRWRTSSGTETQWLTTQMLLSDGMPSTPIAVRFWEGGDA